MRRIRAQPQLDVNASDDEHVLIGLDLADSFGDQASFASRDLTRLQRASKGPAQSTGSAGDDVIERRRVGWRGAGGNLVMLSDRAMHAKSHRLRLSRQPGFSYWSFDALNADLRSVDDVGHCD